MKVYLESKNMDASLMMAPEKVQHISFSGNHIPHEIETHALVIVGHDNKTVTIQGDLAELMQVVVLMAEALEGAE